MLINNIKNNSFNMLSPSFFIHWWLKKFTRGLHIVLCEAESQMDLQSVDSASSLKSILSKKHHLSALWMFGYCSLCGVSQHYNSCNCSLVIICFRLSFRAVVSPAKALIPAIRPLLGTTLQNILLIVSKVFPHAEQGLKRKRERGAVYLLLSLPLNLFN